MRVLKSILRYSDKKQLTIAMILGAAAGGGSTALLAIINRALYLFNPIGDKLIFWGFIGLCLFVAVSRVYSADILQVLGSRLACDLQIELSRKILSARLRRLENLGAHRLLVALTDDIRAVTAALMDIPIAMVNIAVVIGGLVYMALLSWHMMVVVALFMVVGTSTYYWSLVLGVKRQRLERDKEDHLFKHFRGVTEGIQELKIHHPRRESFFTKMRHTAEEFRDLRVAAQRIFIIGASWGNLLFFIVIGVVIFMGSTLEGIDRPVLSGYIIVLLYILGPLQMVLFAAPNLTRADVALEKIERLGLNLLEDAEESAVPSGELSRTFERVELRGVEHTYHHVDQASHFTLGPMNLEFRPGELIFIVGGNGSGKTTLAKLLIGLYAPEKGDIRVDGEAVTRQNREDYRHLFSVVFSNFFLFEDLLGLESPDLDERAQQYLKQLQLQHKVRVRQGRFSTVDLSQGQRKRLALLQACLDDRPIFLFDEWAADQDPEFKKVFYHQILPELKARGKTILAITHDDAYYGVGDRVIKLDYGQIVFDLPVEESPYAAMMSR